MPNQVGFKSGQAVLVLQPGQGFLPEEETFLGGYGAFLCTTSHLGPRSELEHVSVLKKNPPKLTHSISWVIISCSGLSLSLGNTAVKRVLNSNEDDDISANEEK